MKWLILLLFSCSSFAQTINTEVYLFDIDRDGQDWSFKRGKNISQNSGYDNQPSFYNDSLLVYAKNRNDQTDIAGYQINKDNSFWITNTEMGGEFSPQFIPNSTTLTAVRLDTTGLQRLYAYSLETGQPTLLIPDLKVAYYTFYDASSILAVIITDTGLDLVLYELATKTKKDIIKNVGRSVHQVPGSNSLSYTLVNEDQNLDLYLLDLNGDSPSSYFVCELPIGIQDYTWLNDTQILLGSRDKLFIYDTLGVTEWKELADLSDLNLENITRLAVNTSTTKLAVVAETLVQSPLEVVQAQLEAYNNRDLSAFLDTYAEGVKLYNYPNQLISEGKEALQKGYESFFNATPDLNCAIKNRIVIGNKVIDEEYITANGSNFSAVAIYEVEEGLITQVTFIR